MTFLALAFAAGLAAAGPARTGATLVRVIDGDTIQVRIETRAAKIRFLRINTPELDAPGGRDAATALRALLRGCALALEGERGADFERDRYGRMLAYVWCGSTNVNVELVRRGHTRFWTRYGTGHHAASFQQAEDVARREGRGLWAQR